MTNLMIKVSDSSVTTHLVSQRHVSVLGERFTAQVTVFQRQIVRRYANRRVNDLLLSALLLSNSELSQTFGTLSVKRKLLWFVIYVSKMNLCGPQWSHELRRVPQTWNETHVCSELMLSGCGCCDCCGSRPDPSTSSGQRSPGSDGGSGQASRLNTLSGISWLWGGAEEVLPGWRLTLQPSTARSNVLFNTANATFVD